MSDPFPSAAAPLNPTSAARCMVRRARANRSEALMKLSERPERNVWIMLICALIVSVAIIAMSSPAASAGGDHGGVSGGGHVGPNSSGPTNQLHPGGDGGSNPTPTNTPIH